jgi:hypothetical protein
MGTIWKGRERSARGRGPYLDVALKRTRNGDTSHHRDIRSQGSPL